MPAPKYPRPKILIIDAPEVADQLARAGYTAAKGTFGTPLILEREAGYRVPKRTMHLPNHTEQEIVVVDLAGPQEREAKESDFKLPAHGVKALWAPTELGRVDPRLPVMHFEQSNFDRIYEHGGVFIVFADALLQVCYLLAARDYNGLDSYDRDEMDANNWDLLRILDNVQVSSDHGTEVELADNGYAEKLGLASYLRTATFSCVVKPGSWFTGRWITLATSKYGEPVSGVITPDTDPDAEHGGGWVFVLPGVERRADVVQELVEHVLPNLAPQLFPHVEREVWTRRREYELPQITAIKDEIAAAQEATRVRVRDLEAGIERERASSAYLHQLLTASGGDLVTAVISALKTLGFQDVHDVDAEREAAGDTRPKREDVHIMDAEVPVLVEVKGISGLPKEADALQVVKYLAPRMHEWGCTDLKGLSIVNHQRALPALDREDENVFQGDVLTNAQEKPGFGLLTTWDLHRLVRSFLALGWRHEDVAGLFTTTGRVRPVPSHYEYIGHLDGFWEQPQAVGVRVAQGGLSVGDRLAYELPVQFVEETVESLQLDSEQVRTVAQGAHVGVRTSLSKEQARNGVPVYRVRPRTPA